MPEWLEHFGFPCILPESKIVGWCVVCGCEIYDYELTQDEYGDDIHESCED